jgi:hypothetical protein
MRAFARGLLAGALACIACVDAATSQDQAAPPALPVRGAARAGVAAARRPADGGPGHRRKQKGEQRVPQVEALGCNENPVCCIFFPGLAPAARLADPSSLVRTHDCLLLGRGC